MPVARFRHGTFLLHLFRSKTKRKKQALVKPAYPQNSLTKKTSSMSTNTQEHVDFNPLGAETRIPIEKGTEEISAYNELVATFPYPEDVSITKACHVRKEDLLEMLSEGDIDGIRCYFGLRKIVDPKSDMYGMQVMSLVMVGTRLLDDGTNEDVVVTSDGNSGVYEFTTPCPNSCDTSSPLYAATLV